MPNTLGHIGFQVPAVRAFARPGESKWILAGLALPDAPWMLQRALLGLHAPVDPYAVHLYAIAQGSLAVSLVLAAAVALATSASGRLFALLGANVLLHLLLDATEIKWGNGVHLFAPFSWKLTSFDLIWPDSAVTTAFSLFGFLAGIWLFVRAEPWNVGTFPADIEVRAVRSLALLAIYAAAPLALMNRVSSVDARNVAVLRERQLRPGRPVIFDREHLVERNGQVFITVFTGELLKVAAPTPLHAAKVSARGRFIDEATVALDAIHEHRGLSREGLSMVGLALIAAIWARGLTLGARRGGSGPPLDS